jgi:hypothetical protein
MNRKSNLIPIPIFSTVVLLLLLTQSISFANIINPKTYYSTNKQYSLKVIPSNKYGIGQSDIKFSRNCIFT